MGITNLTITSHPIINDVEITQLPIITVVCGPNNSGKSTFLKALQDTKTTFPGVKFDASAVEFLYDETIARATGWHGGEGYGRENKRYFELLVKVSGERELWFLNLDGEFTTKVAESFQSDPMLSRWSITGGHIAQAFKKLFPVARQIILPPKRTLELQAQINTNAGVQATGVGLLNFLFSAKNQPSFSMEYICFSEISSAFSQISGGYRFDVFVGKDNMLSLQFASNNGPWLKAEDCGLGLQDLIVILYYAISGDYDLVCLEEPESHMHPDMQRRLLVYLNERKEKQFFITTHSNVFLNNVLIDRVLVTSISDGRVGVRDATSKASVLDDLGYSVADNLVSDLVILVEGPTDVPVLEELLLKRGLFKDYAIKIWPLGGDIMDQLDLEVITEGAQVIALLDKDPGSSRIRTRFAERCGEYGVYLHILERYAIENYFPISALRSVFGGQIEESINAIEPNKKLETQIGLNVKKNNRRLARAMKLSDIAGTDLELFLEKVRELCVNKSEQGPTKGV